MSEITEDFIARLASKIYNEANSGTEGPSTDLPHSAPSPLGASTSSTLASPPSPSAELPMAAFPISVMHSKEKLESVSPSGIPAFSVPQSSSSVSAPAFTSGGSEDGIKRFVAEIRKPSGNAKSNLLEPISFSPAFLQRTKTPAAHRGSSGFDVLRVRDDFPILKQKVHGKPLVWFDNAATTQKPAVVIDGIANFYRTSNSNIHRAAHALAAKATDGYEQAREKVQRFLGASGTEEIVFVRGTTEGVNLVAQTFGRKFLSQGDEIILSTLEHHANIVPWQMIAQERGAIIRVIPVDNNGEILLDEYKRLLSPKTRIVALTQASNSIGTILPICEMTQMAKAYGARVLIDGAQSVAHLPVNVQAINCDFFVFSGHKIFGPTGIGAVYIKKELHDVLPPWQGGGNMIRDVTFESTTYSDAPAKFEAGTPNIGDAIGLGLALDYVSQLGLPAIAAYEHGLLEYATEHLRQIPGLRILGNPKAKVGLISFVMDNIPVEKVGQLLDKEGIAVRSGHHCSQPSLRRFGVEATVRPSFAFYNTHSEIDLMIETLKRIRRQPH